MLQGSWLSGSWLCGLYGCGNGLLTVCHESAALAAPLLALVRLDCVFEVSGRGPAALQLEFSVFSLEMMALCSFM